MDDNLILDLERIAEENRAPECRMPNNSEIAAIRPLLRSDSPFTLYIRPGDIVVLEDSGVKDDAARSRQYKAIQHAASQFGIKFLWLEEGTTVCGVIRFQQY